MTTDAVGGVWQYSLTLARQLSGMGIRVTLATMGPRPSPAQATEAREIPDVELIEGHFKLEWMDEPWGDVDRAERWLLDLEAMRLPDVVHLNGYCHASAPFMAPTVVVAHACVASWWAAVNGSPLPARYDEYRLRVARGLRDAGAIIAPTHAMRRSLEHAYGIDRAMSVIENGIDLSEHEPGEKEPLILAAGRVWDRAKNLEMLLEHATRLPWPLRIAGDPVRPGGVPPGPRNPTLIGRLTGAELAREMARASVFAHPALYEPFGLCPLEAAAAGSALVLSDIPSLREIWSDSAWFVPPEDAHAWQEALTTLCTDPGSLRTLAARARRRVGELDAGAMATRYLAIYRSLVSARLPLVPRAAAYDHARSTAPWSPR
jgi:glycogen synthase